MVVNAFVHRDYSITGSEVHIDIYDNRLEIVSPGGMFDNKNVQDLDINNVPSLRRNPVICDILHRIHFMERRGSGFHKILAACKEQKPEFYSDNASFRVVIMNSNYNEKSTTKTSDKKQAIKISDKKQAIIEFLKVNETAKTSELSKLLSISDARARAILNEMVNDNILIAEGANRNRVYRLKK